MLVWHFNSPSNKAGIRAGIRSGTKRSATYVFFGIAFRRPILLFCTALMTLSSINIVHAADAGSSSAAAWLNGDQVELLDEAINFYAAIQTQGGWPAIPAGLLLGPGNRHADVPLIRRRLRATRDYTAEMAADPLLFDAQLSAAIEHFQLRYGLPGSGALDRLTLSLLRVPVDDLLLQLVQARADWQEFAGALPVNTDEQRVWVNIPEASVSAIRGSQVELNMRAIVGHPSRPTPVLKSQINMVVVNPTWTVPRSIAVRDILPRQQANSNFLARNRIRVFQGWGDDAPELDPQTIDWGLLNSTNFPYRLRQDAGPGNSLGRYKFSFPNEYDVYLHDTPVPGLLDLSYRSLSSGCVRVAAPDELARWLLGQNSQALLTQSLQGARNLTHGIPLTEAVEIDVVYITAWVVSGEDTVQFRRDIYKHSSAGQERVKQLVGG
jgi:murein L,D-transpeptidase YcbB/YkuD